MTWWRRGTGLEYFHAAEDRQAVRNAVFAIIARHLEGVRIDSLIVEKRKTGPALQPVEHFYPRMLGCLLRHVLSGFNLADFQEVIVFTDRVPVNKHRKAVEKAVKDDPRRCVANWHAVPCLPPRVEVESRPTDCRLLQLGHLSEMDQQ